MPEVLNAAVVGTQKVEGRVYVGRPSEWGNPFHIGRDGTREDVIAKYREYVLSTPALMRKVWLLREKDLVCWCAPEPCHANVLLELANKERYDLPSGS